MTRALSISAIATGVIVIAACSPAEPGSGEPPPSAPAAAITPTAAADLPEAVRAAVLSVRPGMDITGAELKEREGRRYYDVEGAVDGAGIELDLLETPSGWQVVEIQRDIPWGETPAAVRAAAGTARAGFVPVRVIESVQAGDGAVIYELFADSRPATPALEVRVSGGRTEVLNEAWPH